MAYNDNLTTILRLMGYQFGTDFEVWDNGNGPFIAVWTNVDPQPTEQQVDDFYTSYLASSEYLERQKSAAKYEIDVVAEIARAAIITPGSGQAMTYQEKSNEAADYIAAGYPPMGSPPEYPFVHADAVSYGVSHQVAADTIIEKKAEWVAAGVAIEGIRLSAKNSITLAVDANQINTAKDAAIAALRNLQ